MILTLNLLKSAVASYVDENKISVDSFSATYNNTVGLLDTISKIFTIPSNYVDKLEAFDGEELSYGKTIEEWKSDLKLMEDYVAAGSGALSRFPVTYRPVSFSFTLGRKYVPVTIPNNDIERAVHNEEQFAEIIADKYKVMEDSARVYRYAMKREALAVLIARAVAEMDSTAATTFSTSGNYTIGTIVIESGKTATHIVFKPYASGDAASFAAAVAGGWLVPLHLTEELDKVEDTETAEAFITAVKKDVEIASDNSQGYSLNGNCLGATEGLKLIVLQGIRPVVDVKAIAGAFHEDKVALPADLISVPDFGSDDKKAFGILMDSRGMRLHNTYRAVRENINGQGDFLNLFFHVEYTCHCSRNTFLKVYIEKASA